MLEDGRFNRHLDQMRQQHCVLRDAAVDIVELYDIARHEGTNFLVMEYVEGQTLWDVIPPEGMRFEQLVALRSQI